ncbi:transferase family-domain-containing protein [Aspergillus desertorum]
MEGTRRTALSPMDNIMPRFYAKLIFAFRCSAQEDPAKVCSLLQDGLSRASVDVPSIAGKVFHSTEDNVAKGALEVHTNPTWVPKIHLQDLRDVIDYDDWVDEGLPQDELDPDRFFPAIGMPDLHKGAPVFIAQANFVAGGMILAVGMFHSVIDGTSGMWLAKKWAEYTRQLQGVATDDHASLVISPQSTDNQLLMNLWQAEGHEAVTLDDLTHGRKGADDPSLWRLLGLDPVNPSPQPFSLDTLPDIQKPPPPVRSTIFYVSQKALAELKAAAAAAADLSDENGSTEGVNISANDALMALLWRAIIRARFSKNETATPREEQTTLDTTFDGRAHFSPDLPWTYLGSLIFISTARMTISELISSDTPLGRIAGEVRRAANAITTPRIHAAFGLAAALPDYNSLSFPFATFAGSEVCITSWIAWSLFDLDFGPIFRNGGRPEFLRPPRREFDPVCRRCVVLPLQTHGGCEILVSLVSDEMSRLEADPEFSRFASVKLPVVDPRVCSYLLNREDAEFGPTRYVPKRPSMGVNAHGNGWS